MEEVRHAYGVQVERYIELFGTTTQVHADDLALIERHLSIRAVLDVGCGPGHLTEHLRSLDVDATGNDLVPAFIEHASAAHPHGRDKLGSMDRLPVPDRSVPGILAWYAIGAPILTSGLQLRVGASVGVAVGDQPLIPDVLMHKADQALYAAKNSGKNTACLAS